MHRTDLTPLMFAGGMAFMVIMICGLLLALFGFGLSLLSIVA